MPSQVHSKFSASAAKRLMTCPASYGLSLAMDDGTRRANVFSAEGTLAHLIGEAKLLSGVPLEHFRNTTRNVDGFDIEVDQPFLDGVKVYTDYVQLLRDLTYDVKLEQVITPAWCWADLDPLPIELFGTADCIAVAPNFNRMVVADLKFGKGVPVDPRNNEQLLYYAAGALAQLPPDVGAIDVDLVVIQPRIPPGEPREWTTTSTAILAWARDILYPSVLQSILDMGETTVPGEHCQFCPARLGCPAPRELALELSKQRYLAAPLDDAPADPNRVDPLAAALQASIEGKDEPDQNLFAAMAVSEERLKEILDAAVIVEPMFEEARKVAKVRMALGAVIDGWETVPRAGKRSFVGQAPDLIRLLEEKGFNPLPLVELKSPAKIEEKYPEVYAELRPHVIEAEPTLVLQQAARSRKRSPRRDTPALPASDTPKEIGDV